MLQNEKFTPIIDTREQKPFTFAMNAAYEEPVITKLDSGDYSMIGYERKLFIERKGSIAEFATNLTQKRWDQEIKRIKDYKWKFILCEFDYDNVLMFPHGTDIPDFKKKHMKISPNFIVACITNLQVKHGIHVIMCSHKQAANQICIDIMKRVYAAKLP